MASPALRPAVKGKGLNGKIGPVPVKVVIFAAALIVGYLLYRHHQGSKTTSAGTGAAPDASSTIPFPPQDSTGGGASGGGGDMSAPVTPGAPNQFPPVFNFALTTPQAQTLPEAGGNTSTPVTATPSSSSQPVTSFTAPFLPTRQAAQIAGAFYSSAQTPQPPASIYSTILATGGGKTASTAAPRTTALPAKSKLPPIGGRGHIT